MSEPPSPSASTGAGAGGGDDFIRAVLLAYDPTQVAPADVKQRAVQYCQQIKSSADGWKVCLQKLHQIAAGNGPDQVKFLCLDVVQHVVQTRYESITEDDRRLIRNGLMLFVRDITPRVKQQNFIKNKISTVLVMIVKADYPERWPSFFHDFLSLLDAGGIEVMDLFLRVLKVIDEDVVTPDEQRAKQEHIKNTQIKDTMKDTCLKSIIEAMHGILVKYHTTHPPLVSLCLSALAHYIDWIDINLIANDTLIPLFYQFLQDTKYQNEACECIIEVIDKRMQDRTKKLALIKQLRIIDVVTTLSKTELSDTFAINLAKLVDSLGTELIDCMIKLQAPLKSNPSLTTDQTNGVHALLNETATMIEQTMRLAYVFFDRHDFTVSEELLPCFVEYIGMMKLIPPASRTPQHLSHLTRIFTLISNSIAFPDWYDHEHPEEDREMKFKEYRDEIFKTAFTNIVKCSYYLCIELVRVRLLETLNHLNTQTYAQVECSLRLFYRIGQEAPHPKGGINALVATEPVRSLIAAVIASDVSSYPHATVAKVYYDIIVRYAKFLEQHPQAVGRVIVSFLDHRGIRHENASIRAQACYQLRQLISTFTDPLKAHVRPQLDEILQAIQHVIEPELNSSAAAQQEDLSNCNYLCECMGMLVVSNVTADKCRDYISILFQFFKQRLDTALQSQPTWYPHDADKQGNRLAHVIDAIGQLFKPLAKDGPKMADVCAAALESIVQVLQLLPDHDLIAKKTRICLHNMVPCLGDSLIPLSPTFLTPLIQHATAESIVRTLELINQFVTQFKEKFMPVLDTIFLPVCVKVFEGIGSYSHATDISTGAAYSTERVERTSIQKMYYTFINNIIRFQLVAVLNSPKNAPHMKNVLDTLLAGCTETSDPSINRTCFFSFKSLIQLWHASGSLKQAGAEQIKKIIFQDLTEKAFQCILSPAFNPEDAAWCQVLSSIQDLQKSCLKLFDPEYPQYVGEWCKQHLQFTNEMATEYLRVVATGQAKDYRTLITRLIAHKKQAQAQAAAQR